MEPNRIEIEYKGRKYVGRWRSASGRLIEVSSAYGSKTTQIGSTPGEILARTMLRELVQEADLRGEL